MGHIIAALDIGTSKTIAMIAQKDYSGKLSVLQSETLASNDAIRRGRVYNSDVISDIISQLLGKLNNNSNVQIEKIYLGIGGQSLHSHLFNVKRKVENGTITYQLIDSLKEEALNYNPEFEENLGIFSSEFYADGEYVSKPRGTEAMEIEANFQLIIGNPYLKRSLELIFDKKEIPVVDYFISPLATAEAVLLPDEKESGCALVEFGEGVTYVSIYKNSHLKYLVTVPLGGLAITKDIRSLNVSLKEAEELKIKHGSVFSEEVENKSVTMNDEHNPDRKIELYDLNWIIETRVDEIVKNVWNMIEKSGYSKDLNAGIIITGGGALLDGLPQFIYNQTGKEVRLANAKAYINQIEKNLPHAFSCVAGLAMLGKENCVKEKVQRETNLFGEEIQNKKDKKKIETKKDKKEEKDTQTQPPQQSSGIFKRFFDRGAEIVDKGAKMVEKGTVIFKDEDFYDNTRQSNERGGMATQPGNKNIENNTNK